MDAAGMVRLSLDDLEAIKCCFTEYFLDRDMLWLFGSRANLSRKGGDIDLYIETYAKTIEEGLKMRNNFISALESKIGEQKIDIVLNMMNYPHPLPIHEIAKTQGKRII